MCLLKLKLILFNVDLDNFVNFVTVVSHGKTNTPVNIYLIHIKHVIFEFT